jgi:hypothetical protein
MQWVNGVLVRELSEVGGGYTSTEMLRAEAGRKAAREQAARHAALPAPYPRNLRPPAICDSYFAKSRTERNRIAHDLAIKLGNVRDPKDYLENK